MEGIYARESSYLERYVQVGVAGEKLLRVSFPTAADADGEHDLLNRIFAYFEGVEDDFGDVNVALTVPTANREVLEAVREIPYGEQVSVDSLAAAAPGLDPDDPEDAETVRSALAGNPVPLIIPDHRVRDGPSGAPPEVEQRLRSLEGIR